MLPIERLLPNQVQVASIAGARLMTGSTRSDHPARQIDTRAGYQLTSACGQEILVLSQAGYRVWTPVQAISVGDVVAIQRHEPVWGAETVLPHFDHVPRGNSGALQPRNIQLPTRLTKDLAYLLGLLIGDGSMRPPVSVGFTTADPELLEAVRHIVAPMGLTPVSNGQTNRYNFLIHSVVLKRWLNQLGLHNVKAEHKEVPWPVLIAPQACVRAFLQGVFDTDGTAEKRGGGVQFCSSSATLARQVHLLLLQFGIIGRLSFRPNQHAGAWLITMYGAEARKFYERVGFRLARKQERQACLSAVSNSNIDVIPYLPPFTFSRVPRDFRMYLRRLQSPGYAKLREMAVVYPELQELTTPEYFWDRVQQVHDMGPQPCVAPAVAAPSTYAANGFVCHASD